MPAASSELFLAMPPPKVSVLIPCYNHARYVGQAITSVLAQTDPDLELVVIDNGSTDDSWQVIQSFHDPRLKTFRLEHNQGICGAWTFGLEHCHGEWFAFLSSDDYVVPEKHEIQLRYLAAHPDVDVVCGYLQQVDEHGCRSAEPRWIEQTINQPRDFNILQTWMMQWLVCMSANLYRRRLCVAPINGSNGVCDYHFHLLLLRRGCRFAQIQQVFLHYRWHSTNTCQQEQPTAALQLAYLYATQMLPFLRESGQADQAGAAASRFFELYHVQIRTASRHDHGGILLAMFWPEWVEQHCPDYSALVAVAWETRQDGHPFHAVRAMLDASFLKWTQNETPPAASASAATTRSPQLQQQRGWLRDTARSLERKIRHAIRKKR